jgi:high-affinity K+ transport system ATPase subunit B
MALSAFFVALAATFLVATLAHKSISFFRVALSSERIAAQTANCFLLSICLLVTWIVVLQSCVDVAKGGALSELLSVFAFYVALAFLLFNKLRCPNEARPI